MSPTLVPVRLNRVKVAFSSNENRQEKLQVKCIIKLGKCKEILYKIFSRESF